MAPGPLDKYEPKKIFNWVLLMIASTVFPQYPGLLLAARWQLSIIPFIISLGMFILILGFIGIMFKKFCASDRLWAILYMPFAIGLNIYVFATLI